MVTLVVDSSVLIQNLRQGRELFFGIIEKANLGEVKLIVPSVVVMEIWSGKSMNDRVIENNIEKRLSVFEKMNIDEGIAKKAGEIRRKSDIGSMDALIASCAVAIGAEVVTLNRKHFVGIKGLKLYT